MDKKRYLNTFLSLICLNVFIFAFVLTSTGQVHTIEKSFQVEPGGSLRMNIAAGDVIVRGWEYDEVDVRAEVYGSARTLDNLELRFEQDRDDVVIRTQRERRVPRRGWDRGYLSERIVFTINVPYHYHVRINISAGQVDVDHIDGNVLVRNIPVGY